MNVLKRKLAVIALACTTLVGGISCSSKSEKAEPAASSETATITPPVPTAAAGGTDERTYIASVTVTAVDPATRAITLTSTSGTSAVFTAGPEIRNFDQINVGDKLNVTVKERIHIFVTSDGSQPSATHAEALATAPKGAKPGAIYGQVYEVIASVQAIDHANRTADLKFSDGSVTTVKVRPDVDMTRYKVGDSVVIQVSTTLALLVETP